MHRPSKETLETRFQNRAAGDQITDGLETHASRHPIVRSIRPHSERLIDHGFAQAEAAHIRMIMKLATPPKVSQSETLANEIAVLAEVATEPIITKTHRSKHSKDNTRARKAVVRQARPSYQDELDMLKGTAPLQAETPITNGNGHETNGLGATKRLRETPHRTPVARRR